MNSPLLAPVQWQELIIRLAMALLAGAILGLDRQLKQKTAGLRTYMLVSLGAAYFILIPIQLGVVRQSAEAFSRVLQGIIAGIGFVGGGVILHQSRQRLAETTVRGVTSASAIWIAAALGTAAGCGLWEFTLIGAGISVFILNVVKRLEKL